MPLGSCSPHHWRHTLSPSPFQRRSFFSPILTLASPPTVRLCRLFTSQGERQRGRERERDREGEGEEEGSPIETETQRGQSRAIQRGKRQDNGRGGQNIDSRRPEHRQIACASGTNTAVGRHESFFARVTDSALVNTPFRQNMMWYSDL